MGELIDIEAFRRDRDAEMMERAERLLDGLSEECLKLLIRELEKRKPKTSHDRQ